MSPDYTQQWRLLVLGPLVGHAGSAATYRPRRPPACRSTQVVPRTVDQTYMSNRSEHGLGLMDHQPDPPGWLDILHGGRRGSCRPLPAPNRNVSDGRVVPTKFLEVDTASGGFFFQNLGELWTNPEMTRTLPPSDREAAASWACFFLGRGGRCLVSTFHDLSNPANRRTGRSRSTGLSTPGVVHSQPPPTSPTNYAAHYGRSVAGAGQQLSVVGPGSRYKLYIGTTTIWSGLQGRLARRDAGAVTGLGVQSTAAVTVPIKTAEQAWADFYRQPAHRPGTASGGKPVHHRDQASPNPGLLRAAVDHHPDRIDPGVGVRGGPVHLDRASQLQVQSTQAVSCSGGQRRHHLCPGRSRARRDSAGQHCQPDAGDQGHARPKPDPDRHGEWRSGALDLPVVVQRRWRVGHRSDANHSGCCTRTCMAATRNPTLFTCLSPMLMENSPRRRSMSPCSCKYTCRSSSSNKEPFSWGCLKQRNLARLQNLRKVSFQVVGTLENTRASAATTMEPGWRCSRRKATGVNR